MIAVFVDRRELGNDPVAEPTNEVSDLGHYYQSAKLSRDIDFDLTFRISIVVSETKVITNRLPFLRAQVVKSLNSTFQRGHITRPSMPCPKRHESTSNPSQHRPSTYSQQSYKLVSHPI